MIPPEDKERIVITSTSANNLALFQSQGDVSFSGYFWRWVFNGERVERCFNNANDAVKKATQNNPIIALLNDSGNDQGNEKNDGKLARNYTIGTGIMLASAGPLTEEISPEITLSDGITSADIWVRNVTTTGTIEKVWAVITPPDGLSNLCGTPITDLPNIELVENP